MLSLSTIAMGALESVLLALSLAAGPPAAGLNAAATNLPTVSIRIHDYADIDQQDIAGAERQVAEWYRSAGIRIVWRITARPRDVVRGLAKWPSDPAAELSVLIVNSGMARGNGSRNDVAGYAAVSNETTGRVAYVIADRTLRIARMGDVSHKQVLSSVMAHEIAHLLMPTRPHSHDGIMRASWRPWEFRVLPKQLFSRAEVEEIHRSVATLSTGTALAAN